MNSPNAPSESPESPVENSMTEYYQLKNKLLLGTLAVTGFIFTSVWLVYSLKTALSYLLGACVGVIYLRMLAKEVEKIGTEKKRVGAGRLALFVALIIVATRWQQLEVIPVFLGFMTYKAAIILYVLQTLLMPVSKQ